MSTTTTKRYGFWKFVWDVFLGIITGGLWWLYLLIKALRK